MLLNTPRYAVFDPVEERFEWFSAREEAEACARAWLNDAADVANADGWPEQMQSLAVYECRPLLVAREIERKHAIECPEERADHDDCETCEGTGLVDDVEGAAWYHSDDFAYTCNYELVSVDSTEVVR